MAQFPNMVIDNNGQSYVIKIMKTKCMITRNVRHMKKIPITVEYQLREHLQKSRHTLMVDDIFLKLQKAYLIHITLPVCQ